MSNERIISLTEELIESLQGEQLSPDNMLRVILKGMTIVENIKNLDGRQKKELVINVLKNIIQIQIQQEDIKNTMIMLLETIGSTDIDSLVYAAKGAYNFSKSKGFKLCC